MMTKVFQVVDTSKESTSKTKILFYKYILVEVKFEFGKTSNFIDMLGCYQLGYECEYENKLFDLIFVD